MVHSKENKTRETMPGKDLMADILDRVFKAALLKILKELKENVEKVKKVMCERKRKHQ